MAATSGPSGTVSFVAYRPITVISTLADTSATVIDPLTGGLPEIFNDSVLFFIINSASATASVSGSITFAKG
jgi:hypothetical protein